MKIEKEFWSNVKIDNQSHCWTWKLAKSEKGYGIVYYQGVITKAHRIAYKITYGEIPEGKCVLHRCDNAPCCNPSHLFIGTRADNNRDMWRKGRGRIPVGRKFKSVEIPKDSLALIGTMPDYQLAEKLNVNKSTIARRRRKAGIPSFAESTGSDGKYKPGNFPARWLGGDSFKCPRKQVR